MKKLLSLLIAFLLLCTPTFAETTPTSEIIPASWLEPIRYPEESSVMTLYRYDKIDPYLHATNQDDIINEVCRLLREMEAEEVILNVSDVSFVPINRTPGETILELRTGQGNSMRYYLQNDGAIISQRIEDGMMYQGMKFTGGNVAKTVDRLISLPISSYSGEQVLTLPLDLQEIYIYNYQDMTATTVKTKSVMNAIEQLIPTLLKNEIHFDDSDDLGSRMRDLHDISLTLKDGTDITVQLYEDGISIIQTNDSLNVPRSMSYIADSAAYQRLQSILRKYQSACMPIWLYDMPQDRISSIKLTSVQDGRSVTVKPGDEQYDMLITMSTGLVVEPFNLQKLNRRTYPDSGYEIVFQLNDDEVCTVDYTDTVIEVEHTRQDFIAAYRPSRGAPFLTEDFGAFLDITTN